MNRVNDVVKTSPEHYFSHRFDLANLCLVSLSENYVDTIIIGRL